MVRELLWRSVGSPGCGCKGYDLGFFLPIVSRCRGFVSPSMKSDPSPRPLILRLGGSSSLFSIFCGSNLLQSGDCLVYTTTLLLKSGQNELKTQVFHSLSSGQPLIHHFADCR